MSDIEVSSHLFSQAATLMLVGMGFVFAFLGLLIIVIKFLIAPLSKKFPDKVADTVKTTNTSSNDQSAIVAAISVAITQYRKKHK